MDWLAITIISGQVKSLVKERGVGTVSDLFPKLVDLRSRYGW